LKTILIQEKLKLKRTNLGIHKEQQQLLHSQFADRCRLKRSLENHKVIMAFRFICLSVVSYLVLCILDWAEAEEECPAGWTVYRSSCYRFFSDRRPWKTAELHCLIMGSALVKVTTEGENSLVTELAKDGGLEEGEDFWIGLQRDVDSGGPWLWQDGSELSVLDFQKWNSGEPGDQEGCGKVRYSSVWFGFVCDDEYAFSYVCQRDPVEVETSRTTTRKSGSQNTSTPPTSTTTKKSSSRSSSSSSSSRRSRRSGSTSRRRKSSSAKGKAGVWSTVIVSVLVVAIGVSM
jgi:hypothetical protein